MAFIRITHIPTGRELIFNTPSVLSDEVDDLSGCLASHDEFRIQCKTSIHVFPYEMITQCHIELREEIA
jgi:hypothetical protein